MTDIIHFRGRPLSEKEQESYADVINKWGAALNTLKGIVGTAVVVMAFLIFQYVKIQNTAAAVDAMSVKIDAIQSERKINREAYENWKESKAVLDATQTEAINSLRDAIHDLAKQSK